MRKFAIIGLFLLGVFEMAYPRIVVLFCDSSLPQFETQYEALKLNTQQQVFVEQALTFMTVGRESASFFGLVTIALAIVLLVADKRRSHVA